MLHEVFFQTRSVRKCRAILASMLDSILALTFHRAIPLVLTAVRDGCSAPHSRGSAKILPKIYDKNVKMHRKGETGEIMVGK